MNKKSILIVDDDPDFREDLARQFGSSYRIETVNSPETFQTVFQPYQFDLIILDMRLEHERDGMDLLEEIMDADYLQLVIVVTKYVDTETHVAAIEAGAQVYLNKDSFSVQFIVKMAEIILRQGMLRRKLDTLEKRLDVVDSTDMVGDTPELQMLFEKTRLAAEDGSVTVLIQGESGTGKELVARNIHRLSPRRKDNPFVAVSVSGMHRETIYSALFGHERGAFTGANARRIGLLEEAHSGTLFLDEIGDLDGETQVKLLRALETRSFQRLGGNREISVEFQLITATHRNLTELIAQGTFRQDLYYRLQAFEIRVPPLRERRRDIPSLAEHFLAQMLKDARTTATGFHRKALEVFRSHSWPGNIRELKNAVEYSAIQARMNNEPLITELHLPISLTGKHDLQSVGSIGGGGASDFRYYLARSELELCEKTIATSDANKKTELAAMLGYNDRFVFMRRLKKAMATCKAELDSFPLLSKIF